MRLGLRRCLPTVVSFASIEQTSEKTSGISEPAAPLLKKQNGKNFKPSGHLRLKSLDLVPNEGQSDVEIIH